MISITIIPAKIVLRWIVGDLDNYEEPLVQLMAW